SFGGGIGLLEILLVVGGVFLLMRMIRGRQSAPEPAYAGAGASAYGASDPGGSGGGAVAVAIPPEAADRDRGIEHIQQMDRGFERSEEHTSELQSRFDLVCRLLLEKKKNTQSISSHF